MMFMVVEKLKFIPKEIDKILSTKNKTLVENRSLNKLEVHI